MQDSNARGRCHPPSPLYLSITVGSKLDVPSYLEKKIGAEGRISIIAEWPRIFNLMSKMKVLCYRVQTHKKNQYFKFVHFLPSFFCHIKKFQSPKSTLNIVCVCVCVCLCRCLQSARKHSLTFNAFFSVCSSSALC